jgi:hypothetical protein
MMRRSSEGVSMLEVEHLKADNERMLRLLGNTKEYKHFSEICLDSAGLGTHLVTTDDTKGKEN